MELKNKIRQVMELRRKAVPLQGLLYIGVGMLLAYYSAVMSFAVEMFSRRLSGVVGIPLKGIEGLLDLLPLPPYAAYSFFTRDYALTILVLLGGLTGYLLYAKGERRYDKRVAALFAALLVLISAGYTANWLVIKDRLVNFTHVAAIEVHGANWSYSLEPGSQPYEELIGVLREGLREAPRQAAYEPIGGKQANVRWQDTFPLEFFTAGFTLGEKEQLQYGDKIYPAKGLDKVVAQIDGLIYNFSKVSRVEVFHPQNPQPVVGQLSPNQLTKLAGYLKKKVEISIEEEEQYGYQLHNIRGQNENQRFTQLTFFYGEHQREMGNSFLIGLYDQEKQLLYFDQLHVYQVPQEILQ